MNIQVVNMTHVCSAMDFAANYQGAGNLVGVVSGGILNFSYLSISLVVTFQGTYVRYVGAIAKMLAGVNAVFVNLTFYGTLNVTSFTS